MPEWERPKVQEADDLKTLSTEMGFQVLTGLWRREQLHLYARTFGHFSFMENGQNYILMVKRRMEPEDKDENMRLKLKQ